MAREPDSWQTNEPRPFLSIGDVSVWTLGDEKFRVESPEHFQEIEGLEPARQLARKLAGLP